MSVAETVFRKLFSVILDGGFGSGARLPAERELAGRYGVSRVSVRDALQRLVDRRVITTRQGSGATVLPMHQWSARALAPVVRSRLDRRDWAGLGRIVEDALALRRDLVLPLVERAASRLSPGSLDAARRALESAWRVRSDPASFVDHDRRVLPLVLEAAGMYPSLWVVNSLTDSYVEVMSAIGGAGPAPDTYLCANHAIFDALEAGEGAVATQRMAEYLDVVDAGIVSAFPNLLQKGENQ